MELDVSDMVLKERIDEAMSNLTFREREVIKLRYGIGDGYKYTLEDVGHIFKVSRERVRQVEIKAVRKLRNFVRHKRESAFYVWTISFDDGSS